MARIHGLKADWQFYDRVNREEKKAELRLNDRDFRRFDYLRLERVQAGLGSPGHQSFYQITDTVSHEEYPDGLKPGYIMLSLRRCSQEECNLLFELPLKPATT